MMAELAPRYESSDSQSSVKSSRSYFWALVVTGWSRWEKNKNEKRRDGGSDMKRKNKLFCLAGADSKEREGEQAMGGWKPMLCDAEGRKNQIEMKVRTKIERMEGKSARQSDL